LTDLINCSAQYYLNAIDLAKNDLAAVELYILYLLPDIYSFPKRLPAANFNLVFMDLLNELNLDKIFIQKINDECLIKANIQLDVLRLDKIHPVVSGNKWFKLKYYLQQAAEDNCTCIATFGGAFSNHIIAVAYACAAKKIQCIGYIRGERPATFSPTLSDAKALNMRLIFLSRSEYLNRKKSIQNDQSTFYVPEGGYGKNGVKGASEILNFVPDIPGYNYIVCAVGTGTMLAGIVNASSTHQNIIGISVLKNNFSVENEVLALVNDKAKNQTKILHDYHFGGYAKYAQQLIEFMNKTWKAYALPLDFVYTAKAFYAIFDLLKNDFFIAGSKILFVHSGGLQGNRSLKEETLLF